MKNSENALNTALHKLQSSDVDKFEIYWEKTTSTSIEIKDGKLDHVCRATDQGLALRTLKAGRMGFAYTIDLSRDAVESAVRNALAVGALMPADPYNDLANFSSVHYPDVHAFDSQGIEATLEHKIDLARSVEADALKADGRIKRVHKAGFDEAVSEVVLVDSNGEQVRHRSTMFATYLTCVAEQGADAQMGSDSFYANFLDQLPARDVALRAAHDALQLLGAGKVDSMICPVVLKNSVVVELLGFLSSSFSAENIDKNFSLLVGKKGEKLFSHKLNIIDDGCLANGIATAPFDGEGMPMRTTTLVENGTVNSFLYDSYYARKHECASTSNSRRGSIKSPPSIGTTNLYLEAGSLTQEQLIGEVKRGVLITDVMGLHTANPVTGEFSFGASGILIENGHLAGPVKGFTIAGNLIEMLARVSEVGSDLRFWGSVGAPSLLISEASIGGK